MFILTNISGRDARFISFLTFLDEMKIKHRYVSGASEASGANTRRRRVVHAHSAFSAFSAFSA